MYKVPIYQNIQRCLILHLIHGYNHPCVKSEFPCIKVKLNVSEDICEFFFYKFQLHLYSTFVNFSLLSWGIHIACKIDVFPLYFLQYDLIFCVREYYWPKNLLNVGTGLHCLVRANCTYLFPCLCEGTSHWKLKINTGGVCAPHRLTKATIQNLFPLEN